MPLLQYMSFLAALGCTLAYCVTEYGGPDRQEHIFESSPDPLDNHLVLVNRM